MRRTEKEAGRVGDLEVVEGTKLTIAARQLAECSVQQLDWTGLDVSGRQLTRTSGAAAFSGCALGGDASQVP